ncbi:hypothetical protein CGERO_03080 [Corynebacterium gerontici]|uniref:Trans-aconitate 2-methyltransferase n=1 Tax=Corynebacterium gerontici TaxID=2079234 RepID=A0A3G6IYT5_9CORY|nr:hypothetical protein CGERO_03080 [Corynebacterium gerontici]
MVVGYALLSITPSVDAVIRRFYTEVIGPYWVPQRRYVDEHYATIPFPFEEVPTPEFASTLTWSFERLMGYLGTWSAVRHYTDAHGVNPLDALRSELEAAWGEAEIRTVHFPLLLRVGKL